MVAGNRPSPIMFQHAEGLTDTEREYNPTAKGREPHERR
jgi:hypothetical protein